MVSKMENLPTAPTTTGLAAASARAAYSHSQAPPVATPERVKNTNVLAPAFFTPANSFFPPVIAPANANTTSERSNVPRLLFTPRSPNFINSEVSAANTADKTA